MSLGFRHERSRRSSPGGDDDPRKDGLSDASEGAEDIAVVADVYNASLITSKINRMVEKEGVAFSVLFKRGESVELDVSVPVLQQIAASVGFVALTALWDYLKKRKKKVDKLATRSKQHLDVIRMSPQMQKVRGEIDYDDPFFRN